MPLPIKFIVDCLYSESKQIWEKAVIIDNDFVPDCVPDLYRTMSILYLIDS